MSNRIITFLSVLMIFTSCKSTVTLYNGNVGDWTIDGGAEWSFSSDIITGHATGKAGYLITSKTYENFDLTLKFYPDETVNSGIFVNCIGQGYSPTDC